MLTNIQKQSTFAAGAVLLAVSAVLVKVIGVCYKIPLVHMLGAEGMGYFNAAYDVYALLCVISTTGLPVAVSVVINRYPHMQRRIYLLSLALFAMLGLPGTAAVYFGANRIAVWVGAPAAAQSLRFIAPAVLFVCLAGAFRGYYQARRNMLPTAISQVIEAAGKLLFGLLFSYLSLRQGDDVSTAAAYAVLGLSIGTLFSLFYLVVCNGREHNGANSRELTSKQLLLKLLVVAFPVTVGAVLTGLSKVIDLSMIMRRLQDGGMAQSTAVAMYGCYSSMVIPLFNVIPALFGSLAMPLVPHLGHAIAKQDQAAQKQILSTAFRWGTAISFPAALGMGMLSKQILELLFADAGDIQTAVPMLILISMAIPASCMITATSAVLQAYGRAWQPMLSTAVGCLVKAASLYVLCVLPEVGIWAAPISTCLCCTATVCVNMLFIAEIVPPFGFVKCLSSAMGASAIAVTIAALLQRALIARVGSVAIVIGITIVTAVLIYVPIAYKCGLIRISDIKSITSKKEKDFENGYSTEDC